MGDTSLGENIKRRQEELKLSQEYVAEQLGVSRQAVSKWETGQSEPTASNLVLLAQLLGLSLSELVEPGKRRPCSARPPAGAAEKGSEPDPAGQSDKVGHHFPVGIRQRRRQPHLLARGLC